MPLPVGPLKRNKPLVSWRIEVKYFKTLSSVDKSSIILALISFTFANAQSVKDFGKLADENGGKSIHLDNGIPEEMMYGLEVQDPDGNCLEPVWMNPEMANN